MFWNKQPESRHDGGPMDDLERALAGTNLKVTRSGNRLIARHGHFDTRVAVVPPAQRESENGPIKAVIQVQSALPDALRPMFAKPSITSPLNSMATLGALTVGRNDVYIGSRLTMYENEQAWNMQFPLVLFSVIVAGDTLLGAIRKTITGEAGRDGESDWNGRDFDQVEQRLSQLCVCNAGDDGLTAEFGIRDGAVSAAAGHHHTALWQLIADERHPEMGGGLFCLLQMPHQVQDEDRLDQVIVRLNQMEMEPHDLVPHFGAWCRGRLGNNPAYASFLPNAMHKVSGIAVNMSYWALHRTQWADAMLATMGVRV